MMQNCPMKFRIMEFLEDGPKRTDEICNALSKEYSGYDSAYGKGVIKYDCIELVSAGIINEGDSIIDEAGVFQKGKLLTTYSLSDLGKQYLDELKQTVKPQA
ncbi:MAG: hypothetical protein MJZ38_01415 [archaeon]|nr:hypothetical protein [archaeon]